MLVPAPAWVDDTSSMVAGSADALTPSKLTESSTTLAGVLAAQMYITTVLAVVATRATSPLVSTV